MKDEMGHRPNRIPWPPIIYIAAVAAAFVLDALWPLDSWPDALSRWLHVAGIIMACVGLGLDLAAMYVMRQAGTNVLPHRGAQSLVTGGVFAVSRNPIYLGNTLLLAGIALALPLPWLLATALVAAFLVDSLAIRREERHLSVRFGQAFTDYASRVPRWIGFPRD